MAGRLAGAVCVVTGANRGIGRAIAVAFGAQGASVVVTGRSADSLDATVTELDGLGAPTLAASCDVRDEDSVGALGDTVYERFGRVDVVVANAGISGPTRPMHELTIGEWRDCVATDLDGVFLTFRRFVPTLVEQGSGSLVAISSMTGKRPLAGRTPYAAAKMGVIGLVRTLAAELGPYGVRVNAVCPGAVSGPRLDGVLAEQSRTLGISPEEARARFAEAAPLRRMVEASEVAEACVFLAGPGSASVTGEDLNVNAGAAMF